MNKCCTSSCHVTGPCSCGLFHSQTNSFSMLFSMPVPFDDQGGPHDYHISPYNPSSSSVDCTLSLGTPSTRLTTDYEKRANHHERRPSTSSWSSNFCWDLLHSSSKHSPSNKTTTRSSNTTAASVDPLLARRCANCDTTSTPLWRNGPRGPKSLCNACGIRFKKEERRANAAATATTGGGDAVEINSGNSWVHHGPASHKMASCYSPAAAIGNEFRFIDDVEDRDSPFLSWRLNVTDRPGLVHDFTR